jgi:hypothetical protein
MLAPSAMVRPASLVVSATSQVEPASRFFFAPRPATKKHQKHCRNNYGAQGINMSLFHDLLLFA